MAVKFFYEVGEFVEVDVSYGYVFMTVKEKGASRSRASSLSDSEHTLFALLGKQLFLCLPVSMASLCSLRPVLGQDPSLLCVSDTLEIIFQFIIRFRVR